METNVIEFPSVESSGIAAISERVTVATPPKVEAPKIYAGHFLSMIAFDGMITMHTAEQVMIAQDDERKKTKGMAGMWQGWKHHAGEGQVRSRNECAWQFLQSPCMYHDLLDTDLMPQPDHFRRLRRHPEAPHAIICGVYFKKQQKIEAVFNPLKEHEGMKDVPMTKLGLIEISKGGTGFKQIPRSAYERIMKKFPERFYLCDYAVDKKAGTREKRFSFFFHDIRIDQELGFMRDQSEDWAFCEMARAAGVKIYLDTTTSGDSGDIAPIWHRGPALYPLPAEMERLQAVEDLRVMTEKVAEMEKEIAAYRTGKTTTLSMSSGQASITVVP